MKQPISMLRFVLNAHGPAFERYGLLCIASLRAWCGSRVAIRVYQPDNLPPCSQAAQAFFRRHAVEVVTFHNPFLPELLENLKSVPARHLTYNKLFTLLDVEPGERRVFLDADQVLLGDPTESLMDLKTSAALVAVDTPESFAGDWPSLYQQFGLAVPSERMQLWATYAHGRAPEPSHVLSYPFFCSGLVAVTAESRLPALWLETSQALERSITQLEQSFFVDQVALTLAAQATQQPHVLLPRRFSTTPQIFRFISDPLFFHYVGFDALAAQAGRTPALWQHLRLICCQLQEETGLDLRFQLLTQWPRWRRRLIGMAKARLSWLGVPLPSEAIRQ